MDSRRSEQLQTEFKIQVVTLIVPWISSSSNWFCRFLAIDPLDEIGNEQIYLYGKFGLQKERFLNAPSVIQNKVDAIDYSSLSHASAAQYEIETSEKSPVKFMAELDSDSFIFSFGFSSKQMNKMRSAVDKQELVQIFTILFDPKHQIDPTLRISELSPSTSDLLFASDYNALLVNGLITGHTTTKVEAYEEKTCHHPVREVARKVYLDYQVEKEFETYVSEFRERMLTS